MGAKSRTGRWIAMMCGAVVLSGGWSLLAAAPASASNVGPSTGDGIGTYSANEYCCSVYGNHVYGTIDVSGSEIGAFDGGFEGTIHFVGNVSNSSFVAHGSGEFWGTIRGCGKVDEKFSIYGNYNSKFNSFVGTTSGNSPIIFGQSISFWAGDSFYYQAAWVACSSHA
jgi:hypothetical protein